MLPPPCDAVRITTARLGDALPREFLALDVTRMSGMETLSPPWGLIRAIKARLIDHARYEADYRRLMLHSQVEHFEVWEGLVEVGAAGQILCLQCYCRRGKFCHRHILAGMVRDYAEARGHEARVIEE